MQPDLVAALAKIYMVEVEAKIGAKLEKRIETQASLDANAAHAAAKAKSRARQLEPVALLKTFAELALPEQSKRGRPPGAKAGEVTSAASKPSESGTNGSGDSAAAEEGVSGE